MPADAPAAPPTRPTSGPATALCQGAPSPLGGQHPHEAGGVGEALVIDTNVALDLLVFRDPHTEALRAALASGRLRWIATAPMRAELARVLTYPQLAPRLAFYKLDPGAVVAAMDAACHWVPPAPKAPVTCTDPDDQAFIDLAVAHRAPLLSKDRHITRMSKRLAGLGVRTFATWDGGVAR